MTFIIGRDLAELQILKKWKLPYLLNWMEYCDESLHAHWYWQDVDQGIAKSHFVIGPDFAEVQIKIKMALSLEPFEIFW